MGYIVVAILFLLIGIFIGKITTGSKWSKKAVGKEIEEYLEANPEFKADYPKATELLNKELNRLLYN